MPVEVLDINEKHEVSYCVPTWLRDEQVKQSIARKLPRIEAHHENRPESIAIACYGPSLNDTWEQVKGFEYIISCSGSHKFLVERGVIPTWHVEVDPRPHKVELIGPPHPDVTYLIASTCHAKVFDHLEGMNVKLWHVFANGDDAHRLLPPEEWALTGGSSVGLRALTIARFLGFTDLHVFGMDGCEGQSGKHAAPHPMQPKKHQVTTYKDVEYRTTVSMLECAKQTFHELDQLSDAKATFYGEGLVQAMAKDYVPKPAEKAILGVTRPELISAEYARLNAQLHQENLAYGVGGGKHAPTVLKLAESIKTQSVLDYGCGKGYLAKAIPYPIWEYDPAIPGKQESPRPADLVICTDVLEHIEPEKLNFVLDDLRRCTLKVAYLVIHTGPAGKTLPDGRNTHLLQHSHHWWSKKLGKFFQVGKVFEVGPELHVLVGPKQFKRKKAA